MSLKTVGPLFTKPPAVIGRCSASSMAGCAGPDAAPPDGGCAGFCGAGACASVRAPAAASAAMQTALLKTLIDIDGSPGEKAGRVLCNLPKHSHDRRRRVFPASLGVVIRLSVDRLNRHGASIERSRKEPFERPKTAMFPQATFRGIEICAYGS